ncbi:hypothetical protein DQ384_38340 [Sphaerisporangium album]|uniref:Uncharacterized protein n=1 Tax=Sphaerisporangium album TaxID=509200 RepID=A0A367EM75_9ACTN|nr:hypothetical protein [Sphaerisporangium album]RCG19141.1 hypothetical protein DQ384_38340 [Sphaerisporangium album]
MSDLRLAWAVLCLLAEAADELIAAWLGTRTIRWHARRMAHWCRQVYRLALYGTPSDSRAIEPYVFDVELLEDR